MPRPKTPLIDRGQVAALALQIIDTEGLDALSVRRIAAELNVNNKSLYHHFRDKADIIASAAEVALRGIGVPSADGEPWDEWLIRSAQLYRDAILAHPALVTVMFARGTFGFGEAWVEEILVGLEGQGVPAAATMAFIEAIEAFAIGNVLCKTAAATGAPRAADVQDEFPNLARGLRHRAVRYDEQFKIGCRFLIEGIAQEFGLASSLTDGSRHVRGDRPRPSPATVS